MNNGNILYVLYLKYFWVIFKILHVCVKHTHAFGTDRCLLEVKLRLINFFLKNQFPMFIWVLNELLK